MLLLQRASAGSGKTYTLAKTFIRLLISVPDSEGRLRLRSPEETGDAASHILAITFTNKATAEMKNRIIGKLADLAGRRSGDKTDYLADFMNEFGVSEKKIREVSAAALEAILNDYSNFQISTIDSFFQSVLRTFASEVDLNDSYQVELDSAYLSAMGIDLTMRSVNDGTADPQTMYWIGRLMQREAEKGNSWNMFLRPSAQSRRKTLRGTITSIVGQMQREEFKRNKNDFDSYFLEYPDYDQTVETFRRLIETPVVSAFGQARDAALGVSHVFAGYGLDPKGDGMGNLASHLAKTTGHSDPLSEIGVKYEGNMAKVQSDRSAALSAAARKRKLPHDVVEAIGCSVAAFYDSLHAWLSMLETPEVALWQIYQPTLPFPALMHKVRENVQSFLRENNMVELADTNTMLSRVIGDDDAPFIYERIGSRLDHYLIDEFQETSALQWENLSPLLNESVGRAFDSLIIGDAKQSIYRFRNADPSLISTKVPSGFSLGEGQIRGNTREENTNHRSMRRIVEFNNYFFSLAAAHLDRANGLAGISAPDFAGGYSLSALYDNVVQFPRSRDDSGYVEVNFLDDDKDDTDGEGEFEYIGPLIDSLLDRGYRQADIAILVERNSMGQQVIDHLISYNSRPDACRRIDFLSDESLQLGISKAVRIVTTTLEMVALASLPDEESDAESTGEEDGGDGKFAKKRVSRADICALFSYFAANHPDLDPLECVDRYCSDPELRRPVKEMLATMHAVTLPALTEAIIDRFVTEDLKRSDAPFLAAFQDCLLDYCHSYPADVASFLGWWKEKGSKLTITSPEGADAVSVMTVHKSKGLEFKCVILPQFNTLFGKTVSRGTDSPSYLWLPPMLSVEGCAPLPPVFPVLIDHKRMPKSPLRKAYLDNLYGETMDKLNLAYVAFTRAVDELYIFTKLPAPAKKKGLEGALALGDDARRCGEMLLGFLHPEGSFGLPQTESRLASAEMEDSMLRRELIGVDSISMPGGLRIYYGEKRTVPDVGAGEDADGADIVNVGAYSPNSRSLILQYKSRPSAFDEDDIESESGYNARKRGNLLHDILSDVDTSADLETAVMKRVVGGELTPEAAAEIEKTLRECISRPEVKSWFDGSMRSVRERSILVSGQEWRPDRVMVDRAEGRGIVIDYKFGSVTEEVYRKKRDTYRRQVARYMRLLGEALSLRYVEGWVWYIGRGEIEKVDAE